MKMKSRLLTLGLASILATTVYAQNGTRSVDTVVTPTRISVTYLRDGFDDYAAITAPLFTFSGTQGRLQAVTFGAVDRWNVRNQLYVGTGLSYRLFENNNLSVSLVGGWKGLNLSDNFRMTDNDRAWVWGGSVSFKLD